jgi:hypothetical protein
MIFNQDISPFDFVNISCRKGDAFEMAFEYLNDDDSNFDFTGYTAKLQVRKGEGTTVIEEFSTEDGTIILEPGNITLTKETLAGNAGNYLYNLQLTLGTSNKTIISGEFKILPDLTT